MTRKSTDSLNDIIQGLSSAILVEKPCKIIKVHSPYLVDVEYYDKYKTDMLYNVPVKHLQTQNAFVTLQLHIGDKGTIRFLDTDISYYKDGTKIINNDKRCHNINDGIFTLGFYPNAEQYSFPEGEIVIGTRSGTVIKIDNSGITLSGGTVTISGNTSIDGIKFLTHTHTNGNNGANTGAVVR